MTGGGGRHIVFRHPGVSVPKTLVHPPQREELPMGRTRRE
jgi:hypothetical protein